MHETGKSGGEARQHMDAIYRYQRFIYDATRKYYLLGRDKLLAELAPPSGGTVLEVGCGTGRNLILAARRYPDARFYGFDISSEMLKTARANIEKAGLTSRITLAEGDATSFDTQALFGVPAMDRVFVSYAWSMIPPWKAAVPEAMKAVKPGGSLHVVDFGQQGGWPLWFKKALFAWLARFTVTPRAELESELQKNAGLHGFTLRFQRLYRGYSDYAVLERR